MTEQFFLDFFRELNKVKLVGVITDEQYSTIVARLQATILTEIRHRYSVPSTNEVHF
jgi:hypothetical protein